MDELNSLKDIIDEELQNLSVTKKLEKKVFRNIKKSKRFSSNIKINWLRLTTVCTLLLMLFTLNFNTKEQERSIEHIDNHIIEKNDIEIPPRKKLFVTKTYYERFTVMKNMDEDINE